jgi:hypothetical protein
MKLDRVTITGADNSTHIDRLLELSKKFPFVEWGILASSSSEGSHRFPSREWIEELQEASRINPGVLNLSLHLCGKWVRQILLGDVGVPRAYFDSFQRVQLNFHAERTKCNPTLLLTALQSIGAAQYIFQIDGNGGNEHLSRLFEEMPPDEHVDAVGLFDVSGGAGILPGEWPKPFWMSDDESYCYHGYAGGLGPENLAEQIPKIGNAAGDCRIWVDMETRVRSNNDQLFDIDKVVACLEIAEPFINHVIAT